jgi:Rhodanese-related sulfurtransferase
MHNLITLEEAHNYIREGALLIDVRDKDEYDKGYMKNAVNIPYKGILMDIRRYSKETIIILYCSTGKRSHIAFNLLKKFGYNNVYDLGKGNY